MSSKTKPSFSLKDQLFNRDRVQYLSGLFHSADPSFEAEHFVAQAVEPFPRLELKERITWIATTLEAFLSSDFRVAAKQITDALPAPLDPTKTDDDFGDCIFASLGEFIVRNGLGKNHVKLSLRTIKAITQRFSMEDAIRAFINQHTEVTLKELTRWSTDKNYHVRRLVSEGTRPTLPWSKRIVLDVADPLPLLDTLHADSTRYVTRSVANHLNDISKSNPRLVINRLKQWKRLKIQDSHELDWMTRHALRTLVKQGDRVALKFLGFSSDPKVQVKNLSITPSEVKPGEAVEIAFELVANEDESLIVDYVVDFVKANGSTSPKVRKIKQLKIKKGERVGIVKRHPLRDGATTFTLYPGIHRVTLQINGKRMDSSSFEIK